MAVQRTPSTSSSSSWVTTTTTTTTPSSGSSSRSSSPAAAPGVALFRRAQAQYAAGPTSRPLPTPLSDKDESDTASLSSTKSAVSSTAQTVIITRRMSSSSSIHDSVEAASSAASISDAASTTSAALSAPAPSSADSASEKVTSPQGFLRCAASPADAATAAVEAVLAEFVPLAAEGGYCSAVRVRGLARRGLVGRQMVPDSKYPAL